MLLCDKGREILTGTSTLFIQFREALLAMEGKAGAKGLAAESTLYARFAPEVTGFCKLRVTTICSQ